MPHAHQSPRSAFTNKKFSPPKNLKARIGRAQTKVDWTPEVKKSMIADAHVTTNTDAGYKFRLPQELKKLFLSLAEAVKTAYRDYRAAKQGKVDEVAQSADTSPRSKILH